jgi:hypothetical protein
LRCHIRLVWHCFQGQFHSHIFSTNLYCGPSRTRKSYVAIINKFQGFLARDPYFLKFSLADIADAIRGHKIADNYRMVTMGSFSSTIVETPTAGPIGAKEGEGRSVLCYSRPLPTGRGC